MKVKRFVVFGYNNYEACGGWEDMVDSFDTLDEAKKCGDEKLSGYKKWEEWGLYKKDNASIIDLETGKEIGRRQEAWDAGWGEIIHDE